MIVSWESGAEIILPLKASVGIVFVFFIMLECSSLRFAIIFMSSGAAMAFTLAVHSRTSLITLINEDASSGKTATMKEKRDASRVRGKEAEAAAMKERRKKVLQGRRFVELASV